MAVKFSDFSIGAIGADLEIVGYDSGTVSNVQVSYSDLKIDILGDAVTGTGASGQVAYWNGTETQAGSNNLFWNNTNQTLGIGTTSPIVVSAGYSYLALNNSVNGGVIEFQSNGTRIATINNNASSFDIETKISAPITFGTNGSERMRITSVGNVGIGTTSPTVVNNYTTLDLRGTNGGIMYFGTSSTPSLRLIGEVTDTFIENISTGSLIFRTTASSTERMRLTNGGNLLVGTATDLGYKFSVSGTSYISDSANTILTLNSTNATGYTAFQINDSGVAKALIGYGTYLTTDGGFAIRTQGGVPFTVAIGGGTPNFTIASTGAATLSNDLLISGVFRQTVTTNRQTASYTLVLTDRGKLVEMNVATANNLTVPLNSAIQFPIGAQIDISQYGAGQTTVVATGGVTVRSAAGALKLAAQYSGATLVKIATDEWYLFGDITV